MFSAKISESLKNRVEERIQEGMKAAKAAYGDRFEYPTIIYNPGMGTTAGWANRKNVISLNSVLLEENTEEFIARTVPHELSHLVTFVVHPKAPGHGMEWRGVCKSLGMTDIRPCHSYDVTSVQKVSGPHAIGSCNCGKQVVSMSMATKIKLGHIYRCTKCNQAFKIEKVILDNSLVKPIEAAIKEIPMTMEDYDF